MKIQRFTKQEFSEILNEMLMHKGKALHLFEMELGKPPTSDTRRIMRRFMNIFEQSREVFIKFHRTD